MQVLRDYLTDHSVRLVSVVGRGGMGKTALVSRVLADLERGVLPIPGEGRELSIDGILYLGARSTGLGLERIYTDVGRMLGEPVASRLAARWADRSTPLAAKVEYLLEVMHDGLYIILLDNLEDRLTEVGEIAEEGLRLFVERCLTLLSGARLIVTSRKEARLAPATLHRTRRISLRDGLPEEDAIDLLRELDPQGELGLRDASEDRLCSAARLTQGIPRALEVLAGILDRDPTTNLPTLLADKRLFGKQVMKQLVAEGYDRLQDDERRIMEALAVFDRPVVDTAIAYLLHPWFPSLDVGAALRHLVSSYFVSANRETREYSLHPLDREYAYHQLPDSDEPDAYSRRNLELRAADFYASIRKPESEWKTIHDLAPQLAEFEHRVRAWDYDGACRVLEPIDSDYLFLWGHYARLVELREKLLGRLTDPSLQETNLGNLGRAYRALGQFKQAIGFFEEALVIAHDIGDKRSEGVWYGHLGRVYRALGEIERSVKLFEEALTVAREIGNRQDEASLRGHLGTGHRVLGQIDWALKFYEEALVIAREISDRRREGLRLGSLGRAHRALGQTQRAIELYEQSLAIACEINDRRAEGVNLGNLGTVFGAIGQIRQSIELHRQSLAIARQIGDRWGESWQLLELGKALLAAGELPEAQQCCSEALTLDVPTTSYQAALVLGIVLFRQDDPDAGRTFIDAASRCRAMLGKTAGLYEPRYALATALVGRAVRNPRWAEESERTALLAPALVEYQRSLENCAALGVVRDALHDLEMIRAAGIEGLEPVFELLQAALEV